MNIWSRLGISVALVALFSIAAAEFLQPTHFYQRFKWGVCAAVLTAGALCFAVGRWLNHRIKARHVESQRHLLEQDRDQDPSHGEPFLLFNLAYWGVMMLIFGVIVVFIVPTHNRHKQPKVTARGNERTSPKTTVITNTPPPFHLQGIVLRAANPSALINGRTYFVGDFVDGARVASIDTNSVLLEWRGIKIPLVPPD